MTEKSLAEIRSMLYARIGPCEVVRDDIDADAVVKHVDALLAALDARIAELETVVHAADTMHNAVDVIAGEAECTAYTQARAKIELDGPVPTSPEPISTARLIIDAGNLTAKLIRRLRKLPPSREHSLAITNAELAFMWLNPAARPPTETK